MFRPAPLVLAATLAKQLAASLNSLPGGASEERIACCAEQAVSFPRSSDVVTTYRARAAADVESVEIRQVIFQPGVAASPRRYPGIIDEIARRNYSRASFASGMGRRQAAFSIPRRITASCDHCAPLRFVFVLRTNH
jgi:hypothetical protein